MTDKRDVLYVEFDGHWDTDQRHSPPNTRTHFTPGCNYIAEIRDTAQNTTPMRHRCETCHTVDGHMPGCAENVPPEDPLPDGVFEHDGKLFYTCLSCGARTPLECDLDEFDPEVAYCGGSPRCLP